MLIGENERGPLVVFDKEHPHEVDFLIKLVEAWREMEQDPDVKEMYTKTLEQLRVKYQKPPSERLQ